MRLLSFAARQRLRDWPTSAAFVAVLGSALAVAGTWLAIAEPLLPRRLPFPEPDRLVALEAQKQGQPSALSWDDLERLRTNSVETVAGFLPRTWGLQTEPHGHVEVVLSQQVTGEFFAVLGTEPYLGESLSRRHEQHGNQQAVWLTYRTWQRLLGGDPQVAGRLVWINAVAYRVAGVLPPQFEFPHRGPTADVYLPLPNEMRQARSLHVIARLTPDSGAARYAEELKPRFTDGLIVSPHNLTGLLLGDRLRLLNWLFAAVVVLLLVAMANAGGIWLAQWLKQQRHAAIQLALGAERVRLWKDQAAQALVLGLAAALAGALGTVFLLALLHTTPFLGSELARFELWQPAHLNWVSALALLAVALTAAVLSAALPLVTVRAAALGARTGAGRHSYRVRLALAIAQLTLSGALAYTGILIARNVQALFAADRGFRTEQIVVAGIGVPEAKYNTDERLIDFHRRAIAELSRIPGVNAAGGGISLPISHARTRFLIDDENVPRDEQRQARFSAASPELLPLLGIPLQRGRGFTPADRWGAPRVALVNRAFAERYLGADPLGHRLRVSFYNGFAMTPYETHQIIGLIGDTLNRDLALDTEPQIIVSSNQIALEGFQYFLRTPLPAESLRSAVEQAIWRVDPEIQRVSPEPLADRVEQSLVARRALAWLAVLFGGLAALIVIFGLASSLAATFVEMTRELGIRAALGASPLSLAGTAVRWGAVAVAASWLLTLPIAYALGEFLGARLEPANWLLAGVVLATIGLASAYLPARRAAKVNPASTLRAE